MEEAQLWQRDVWVIYIQRIQKGNFYKDLPQTLKYTNTKWFKGPRCAIFLKIQGYQIQNPTYILWVTQYLLGLVNTNVIMNDQNFNILSAMITLQKSLLVRLRPPLASTENNGSLERTGELMMLLSIMIMRMLTVGMMMIWSWWRWWW